MTETKLSNPKDAIGVTKPYFSTVPSMVVAELGLAMLEGAAKYGRHNYRAVGVRASVYYDAARRHMDRFWDLGENIDPDSGLHHLVKAMACLAVIRDSMLMKNWVDDRPPPIPTEVWGDIERLTKEMLERYPEPKQAFTALGN